MMHTRLTADYYRRSDIVDLAKAFLGKKLVVRDESGALLSGIIVETEAYNGIHDKACHAYNGRRTARTETMYRPGGCTYVYLTYGIHRLLNIICGAEGDPQAVLIRAIEPVGNVEMMLANRKLTDANDHRLTSGPGMLTQALGITLQDNGNDLVNGKRIWIEETGLIYQADQIIASPRVGIGYAEEHIDLPWRFRVKENKWTGRAK